MGTVHEQAALVQGAEQEVQSAEAAVVQATDEAAEQEAEREAEQKAVLQEQATLADDFVAIDSILFLAVCICSYNSLRTADQRWRKRLERLADLFFMVALTFMAVICGLIAWMIA